MAENASTGKSCFGRGSLRSTFACGWKMERTSHEEAGDESEGRARGGSEVD